MFDAEKHTERIRIINHGKKKWPDEKNITKLYQMACKDLGIEPKTISTAIANHLPSPEESAKENPKSKFTIICPKCGKRAYFLTGLCKGCKEAEGGTYKTKFSCYECGHSERSKEPLVIWMQRLAIEFGTQSKKSMGIVTITDEGEK
jgi:hypothetical protein